MVKYPDFLADFKEIAALAEWQKSVMNRYCYDGTWVLNYIKLVSISDHYDFLKKRYGNFYNEDDIITLHRRYSVTTLEVLKEYIGIWLKPSATTIEYQRDTNTLTVRTSLNEDNSVVRRLTRNIIPCNMVLDYAVAE